MTIKEFLLARIAEDEAVARCGWHGHGPWPSDDRVLAECEAKRKIVDGLSDQHVPINTGMARWFADHPDAEPDEWLPVSRELESYYGCGGWEECNALSDDAFILLTLAAVYSDHPDYDPEWAS